MMPSNAFIRNLALTSSANVGAQRVTSAMFDEMDSEAWIIEFARTHMRLQAKRSLTHNIWAEYLGLSTGRKYRATLMIPNYIRNVLVNLSRRALLIFGQYSLEQLCKTVEFVRWSQAVGVNEIGLMRRRGRRPEPIMTASNEGKELENLRCSIMMPLKKWTAKIGTSENTYRLKLELDEVPLDWVDSGQLIVSAYSAKRTTDTQDFKAVTELEIMEAEKVVWQSYCDRKKELIDTMPTPHETPAPNPERAEVDLGVDLTEEFEPSDETPLEELDNGS